MLSHCYRKELIEICRWLMNCISTTIPARLYYGEGSVAPSILSVEGVLPSYLQLLIGVEGESLQRSVKLFCSLKTKITQDFARDCFVVSLLATLFLVTLCTAIRTLPQHLYATLFDHLSPTCPMCTIACSSFLPYLSPVPIYDLFAQHFSRTLFNLCVHCMRLNNVSRLRKLVW